MLSYFKHLWLVYFSPAQCVANMYKSEKRVDFVVNKFPLNDSVDVPFLVLTRDIIKLLQVLSVFEDP